MKKSHKRFFSMLMVFVMTLSFSTVAFASKTDENSNVVINGVSVTQDDDADIPEHLTRDTVSPTYSDTDEGGIGVRIIPVTVSSINRYMYFLLSLDGTMNVDIRKDGVRVGVVIIPGGKIDGEWLPIIKNNTLNDNYWEPGNYEIRVHAWPGCKYSYNIITQKGPHIE